MSPEVLGHPVSVYREICTLQHKIRVGRFPERPDHLQDNWAGASSHSDAKCIIWDPGGGWWCDGSQGDAEEAGGRAGGQREHRQPGDQAEGGGAGPGASVRENYLNITAKTINENQWKNLFNRITRVLHNFYTRCIYFVEFTC